jgi:hypothetical protein
MTSLPNFLIIGAAKCGTTSLYHYLRQHPQVFMSPVKEPRFFAFDGTRPDFRGPHDELLRNESTVWRFEDYVALFAGAGDALAVGEASPWYLNSERAAERIRARVPGARLVAVLRDPAERAYSEYLMQVRDGRETVSFEEALRAEPGRIREGWSTGHYRERGRYFAQLQRYFERFERERMRVYLYEDLARDPRCLLRDLFGFLGVDPAFEPDLTRRYNVSGTYRNPLWRLLWTRSAPLREAFRPFLPPGLRHAVGAFFTTRRMHRPALPAHLRADLVASLRDDMLRLQEALGRDLSAWLRC